MRKLSFIIVALCYYCCHAPTADATGAYYVRGRGQNMTTTTTTTTTTAMMMMMMNLTTTSNSTKARKLLPVVVHNDRLSLVSSPSDSPSLTPSMTPTTNEDGLLQEQEIEQQLIEDHEEGEAPQDEETFAPSQLNSVEVDVEGGGGGGDDDNSDIDSLPGSTTTTTNFITFSILANSPQRIESTPCLSAGHGYGLAYWDGRRFCYTYSQSNLLGKELKSELMGPARIGKAVSTTSRLPPILGLGGGTSNGGGILSWKGVLRLLKWGKNKDECLRLTKRQQQWLLDGLLYFNIRTDKCPKGEIRGQILRTT